MFWIKVKGVNPVVEGPHDQQLALRRQGVSVIGFGEGHPGADHYYRVVSLGLLHCEAFAIDSFQEGGTCFLSVPDDGLRDLTESGHLCDEAVTEHDCVWVCDHVVHCEPGMLLVLNDSKYISEPVRLFNMEVKDLNF